MITKTLLIFIMLFVSCFLLSQEENSDNKESYVVEYSSHSSLCRWKKFGEVGFLVDFLKIIGEMENWNFSFNFSVKTKGSSKPEKEIFIHYGDVSSSNANIFLGSEFLLIDNGRVYIHNDLKDNFALDLESNRVGYFQEYYYDKQIPAILNSYKLSPKLEGLSDLNHTKVHSGKLDVLITGQTSPINSDELMNYKLFSNYFFPVKVFLACSKDNQRCISLIQRIDLYLKQMKSEKDSPYWATYNKWNLKSSLEKIRNAKIDLFLFLLITGLISFYLGKRIRKSNSLVDANIPFHKYSQEILNSFSFGGVVLIHQYKMKIQSFSEAIPGLLEYSTEDLLNMNSVMDLFSSENHLQIYSQIKSVKNAEMAYFGNSIICSKKGHKIPVYLWLKKSMDKKYIFMMLYTLEAVIGEIQKEKENEKHIIQRNKLLSLEKLSGGIAHEFNNQLMEISGNVELLKLDRENQEASISSLNLIMKSIQRASQLTGKLLAFAGKGNFIPVLFSLHQAIQERILGIPESIKINKVIKLDLLADRDIIQGDRFQIETLLDNLLINAFQSMDKQGKLYISTQIMEIDESYSERLSHPISPGVYLCVQIEDTGCGMLPEVQEQIFEPFFTTQNDRGRGMGMPAVFGIVQSHKGNIEINSIPEMGTTIRVLFPVLENSEKT